MPNSVYQRILHNTTPTSLCNLTPSSVKVVAYGGTTIKQHGSCLFGIRHGKEFTTAKFFITETKGPVLIGLPTCKALGLVSLHFPVEIAQNSLTAPQDDLELRNTILQQYSDVFDGIGCFQGTYHISVDTKVPPVVHPPRRIPLALRDRLKEELDSLVNQEILTPVTYPTDWVNSCVCVTKSNGKL